MNKIINALSSRTVWTIVVMVIVNGVPSVMGMFPTGSEVYVNLVLGALATYFRVNPKV